MPFDSLFEDPVAQRIVGAAVFGGFVIAAVIARLILAFVARHMDRLRFHSVAPSVVRTFRNTLPLLLITIGVVFGVSALPEAEDWRGELRGVLTVSVALLVAHTVASIIATVVQWYVRVIAPRTDSKFDDKMLPILRRLLVALVYGIAALVVLDSFGVSISPLLGGLGISGLAVALAVQPTLSNFFAGAYVLSDGAISTGDYIELQGGPAGYVVEVGWRSTKIRTWLNNRVVIPNSIMADTIVTNYSAPDNAMNVMVVTGVSYDSDLQKVEDVSMEVARGVIKDLPDALDSMDAYFGFDSFGDSNIGFWLFLQARDRLGSFVVTNELIKRLHARFKDEGIEINYPVRKLLYDKDAPPIPVAMSGQS